MGGTPPPVQHKPGRNDSRQPVTPASQSLIDELSQTDDEPSLTDGKPLPDNQRLPPANHCQTDNQNGSKERLAGVAIYKQSVKELLLSCKFLSTGGVRHLDPMEQREVRVFALIHSHRRGATVSPDAKPRAVFLLLTTASKTTIRFFSRLLVIDHAALPHLME